MDNIFNRPVIGVVMCRYRLNGHLTQTLQEKYLNAVIAAGGLPIALPHALAEPEMLAELLPRLDGILLPGSPSNVQPHLYGENGDEPDADPGRDALSLALIRQAFDRRIPLFAICRGMQEMVVATQGTLQEGGLLSQLIPDCNRFWVNSLHGQGAKTLGASVRIEAHAADGLVEAISVRDQPFALGVQWHPEWNSDEYALSRLLFDGFITACRNYQKEKRP